MSAELAGGAVSSRPQWGPTSIWRLLLGLDGLVAGWAGAIWVAGTTLWERLDRVPFIYERPRDVVTHFAAEVAAGACVATLGWLLLVALAKLFESFGPDTARRAKVVTLCIAVLGAAAGALVCGAIVRPSSRWSLLPPLVWWTASSGAGAAGLLLARHLLALPAPRHLLAFGIPMLALAAVLEVWSLEHYIRHYGRLLGLVQVGTAALATVGARLTLARLCPRRGFQFGLAGSVALSLAWVAGVTPGFSSRSAVLVWGGVAKHLTLDALWPLADRDGDGVPSRFWGADPDDHDAAVTPFGHARREPWEGHPVPPLVEPAVRRDLLFVVVDTTRRSSFERLFAGDPVVQHAFAGFTYFSGYETCATRTDEVLPQLLGPFRCDERPLPGDGSLVGALRAAGYHERSLRYYPIKLGLKNDEVVSDDAVLLAKMRKVVETPSAEPRALILHLGGGHDYAAGTGSPQQRYEARLKSVFEGVAGLIEAAPSDRFTVVVLGDHGEAFWEHLSPAHANILYQEVLETPFLIRSPVHAPGPDARRTSCPDVAWETLRGLGLWTEPVAPLAHDYAVLDLLRGQQGRSQRDSLRSLRVGDMKAIFSPQTAIWELYDLARDPEEKHSLAESEPWQLAPMKSEILQLEASCPGPPITGSAHGAE